MIKPSPKIPCACDQDRDQLALFCQVVAPKKLRTARETPTARYARYKPRVRSLCDDCVADIHRRGVAVAPLPRPVRWRRTGPDGVAHLCEHHKELRTEQESQ